MLTHLLLWRLLGGGSPITAPVVTIPDICVPTSVAVTDTRTVATITDTRTICTVTDTRTILTINCESGAATLYLLAESGEILRTEAGEAILYEV